MTKTHWAQGDKTWPQRDAKWSETTQTKHRTERDMVKSKMTKIKSKQQQTHASCRGDAIKKWTQRAWSKNIHKGNHFNLTSAAETAKMFYYGSACHSEVPGFMSLVLHNLKSGTKIEMQSLVLISDPYRFTKFNQTLVTIFHLFYQNWI